VAECFYLLLLERECYDDATFIKIIEQLLKLEIFFRERNFLSDLPVIKKIWEIIFFGIIKEENQNASLWKKVSNNLNYRQNLRYIVDVWSVKNF
jgi:hypothetical protein